jgi:hypothetical protein
MTLPGNEEESTNDLVVKIKIFDLESEKDEGEEELDEDEYAEPKRLRVRFTKKRGDLMRWYEIFSDM